MFKFDNRHDTDMLMSLGRFVQKTCKQYKDKGVLVFFPSYTLLKRITTIWKHLTFNMKVVLEPNGANANPELEQIMSKHR